MMARKLAASRIGWALTLALAVFGCDDGGGGGDETPAPTPDAAAGGSGGEGGSAGAGGAGGGAGGGGEGGAVEEADLARAAGRMTIEQLARSIPVITGGIEWTEDFGQGEINMLDVLAGTLGAPDYRNVTEENLEPTLIIAKFMQDASNRICVRWIDQDMAAAAADRTFVHHDDWQSLEDEDVLTTLRALQLRFYARQITDDAQVSDLRELFEDASSTAREGREAQDGWLAVCIAMMTDPEFVLY